MLVAVEPAAPSLRRIAAEGTSLLLVEQYINRAIEMADQVVLLDRGQVAFRGAPSEFDKDSIAKGYLGASDNP
jgi:branched-chain amino acid transport system ATP-binding protein